MLKGFLKCHKDRLHADPKNPRTIASNSLNERPKVGIVTGGGSGHKPAFIGYFRHPGRRPRRARV